MSEQQVIGGFKPNEGNFNQSFKVITRKRTSADNAWEGLKEDGETEYHVYDKHWQWVPVTPTLETMLTEWRDLEARAQAAQAEADALFEHAGQCHGEIVVRLAELGWGAPRGPMVPGEPVVTLNATNASGSLSEDWWKHVKVGDMLTYCVGDGKYHNVGSFTDGQSYRVTDLDGNDNTFPWELKCDDGELELWGSPDYFTPSTQP